MFVVANRIGGQVLGAFDGKRLVGFCVAIPGLRAGGQCFLHSHMLGVLPEFQDRGIGRMLKLAQRNEALSRGIDLIEWTFDPLEIKNARFNVERLGVLINRFVANQYGTTSSPLHAGLPTDRCVAEWWIASPRVRAVLDEKKPLGRQAQARIEIPREIGELRKDNLRLAREVQARVRKEFEHWFSQGLTVVGYEITPQAGAFLLGPWPAPATL
jgi:predicted GNAT superfamily acetyltransferase